MTPDEVLDALWSEMAALRAWGLQPYSAELEDGRCVLMAGTPEQCLAWTLAPEVRLSEAYGGVWVVYGKSDDGTAGDDADSLDALRLLRMRLGLTEARGDA